MRIATTLLAVIALSACAAAERPADTEAEAAAPVANSQDDLIRNAERAGPASIATDSTIMDWEMNVVREGTNGWTCLPDRPDTEGDDPYCLDAPWLAFLDAYVNQTEPDVDQMGFAYMLVGDSPVSNSDPYATEPTGPEDWVTDLGSHLMILVPDLSMLEGLSTDHMNGGPWVMWPDTPYAHIMVPVDSRFPTDTDQ
jgi:hypothetical protein